MEKNIAALIARETGCAWETALWLAREIVNILKLAEAEEYQ